MALFFFVIGLELKREFMAGELSNMKKPVLPMMAALGGMLVPALIYLLFNQESDSKDRWGIPMATDIVFELALLSLADNHIPASLKVFLSALAVADDIGAVLVIAFFYNTQIYLDYLIVAVLFLGLLVLSNVLGIRSTVFYFSWHRRLDLLFVFRRACHHYRCTRLIYDSCQDQNTEIRIH